MTTHDQQKELADTILAHARQLQLAMNNAIDHGLEVKIGVNTRENINGKIYLMLSILVQNTVAHASDAGLHAPITGDDNA